ncbi:MAG: RNA polymerase sigma factor [Bacteroidales bacterium]|nr:RNA polymerase sigma factor [Bacteroidales bacterium]
MGSEEFNKVWLPLAERFFRVAFHILESEAEAQDAVQDLFVKLWKRRDTLGDVNNPLALGLTMIKNLCLDRVRSASRSRTIHPAPETLASVTAPDELLDEGLIKRENLERIRECMARLPEKQRKVLEMRIFENMPYSEIALRTGLSEINVRVKLSEARKKLKRMTIDEDNR